MKLEGLQVLRAAACLTVLLYHAQIYAEAAGSELLFGLPEQSAYFAVAVLFVVSAYITTLLYGDRREVVQTFVLKRFWRIMPIYWLVTLACYIGLLIIPGSGRGDEFTPAVLFASLTLAPVPATPALHVAWTLQWEFAFWAIFAIWLRYPRFGAALGLTAGGVALFFSPLPLCFALGIALAMVGKPRKTRAWPKPLVRIGDASCSIYLVHAPAISLLGHLGTASHALLIAGGLCAGLLVYELMERPIRSLKLELVRSVAFEPSRIAA